MLESSLQEQLKAYLAHLKHPIEISAHLDDSEDSQATRVLLDDIRRASSQVTIVEPKNDRGRIPSFAIHKPGEKPRVTFAGLPLGHEFTSLVLALLHVSGHPPKQADETLAQVRGLQGPLRFETYFSQSCQNCPDVVQSLNIMAALNENVQHVAVDGGSFAQEVEDRQIMAVPTIYLNGEPFGQGRMELHEILAQVDTSVGEKAAAEIDRKDPFDMLVIGGGPAGAAAAIYAARKGIRTGVVADRFGGQVLDTLAIENFISVTTTEGPRLAAALEEHVRSYPVDIMKHQRAVSIKPGELHEVELESGARVSARSLVIATGARWRDLGVPGEQQYRNRGVTYCPHCDGPLFKGKHVAVVGGGNSGVEAAIDLAGVVKHVTLLEFAPELKADEILQRKLRSLSNVDVITSARTIEIFGNDRNVTGLSYEDRTSSTVKNLTLEGVFVQIGLLPNTTFLEGTIELSKFGEIIVDDHGRTSLPGIFAAGDVTTVPYKQIIIATGEGAKAALGAFDYLIRSSAPEVAA